MPDIDFNQAVRVQFGGDSGIAHYCEPGQETNPAVQTAIANFEEHYRAQIPRHVKILARHAEGTERIGAIHWNSGETCQCVRDFDPKPGAVGTYLNMPVRSFSGYEYNPMLETNPVDTLMPDAPTEAKNQKAAGMEIVEEVTHAVFSGLERRSGFKAAVKADLELTGAQATQNAMRFYLATSNYGVKRPLDDGVYAGVRTAEMIPDLLHSHGYFCDISLRHPLPPEQQLYEPVKVLIYADDRMNESYPNSWPMMREYDAELRARAGGIEAGKYMPESRTVQAMPISEVDDMRRDPVAYGQKLATAEIARRETAARLPAVEAPQAPVLEAPAAPPAAGRTDASMAAIVPAGLIADIRTEHNAPPSTSMAAKAPTPEVRAR